MTQLIGTAVVSGVAYAPARWSNPRPGISSSVFNTVAEPDRDAETDRFERAIRTVSDRYRDRARKVTDPATRSVLEATAELVKDRGLLRMARKEISAGSTAEAAVIDSIDSFIHTMNKLGGIMAERATDLRDIRDRVVACLMDLPEFGIPESDTPIVLLTSDLSPADAAMLDPAVVHGLVLSEGGPTSHTSIVARQRGIPCVVAVRALDTIPDGTWVLLDGELGTISADVDQALVQEKVAADHARRVEADRWVGPGMTADGHRVALLANVQDARSSSEATQSQAEGIGLFRTELAFGESAIEPSLEEQTLLYQSVFSSYRTSPVIVRTLDAGSEKSVPFLRQESEENPALGVRGVRYGEVESPGLLERQLNAIAAGHARSGATQPARVMAPMVSTVDEARQFAAAVRSRGMIAGIMVEVPAVCVLAGAFVAEVDFLSIGTNDLTQYVMAADRLSPSLVALNDPWQPAVLRLIAVVTAAGKAAGKHVGVCGEAATDPHLASVLVGLGASHLSMADKAIASVGGFLSTVTVDQCFQAATAALAAQTAREARRSARCALGVGR